MALGKIHLTHHVFLEPYSSSLRLRKLFDFISFSYDILTFHLAVCLARLGNALLVWDCPLDRVLFTPNYREIKRAGRGDVQFHSVLYDKEIVVSGHSAQKHSYFLPVS
jgi:hypothetical protein